VFVPTSVVRILRRPANLINGMDAPAWYQNGSVEQPLNQVGASRMNLMTIGIDLAKNVFQLHYIDERGKVVMRKQPKRP
jgi:transposase